MIKEILITSLTGRGSVVMKDRAYKGYWLDTTNWGQVQGTHQTYSFPDQVGESIASTTIEKRPLSIIGWVVEGGTKDMRQRCDFLNSFFSPVEDYTLEYEGKKIVFRPDASIQYPPDPLHNNELVRKFMLTGTIAYPLFTDKTDTAAAFDSTGKLFRFPNSFGRVYYLDNGKVYLFRRGGGPGDKKFHHRRGVEGKAAVHPGRGAGDQYQGRLEVYAPDNGRGSCGKHTEELGLPHRLGTLGPGQKYACLGL